MSWWGRLNSWVQGLIVLGAGVAGFALLFGLRPSPAILDPPRAIPTVSVVPVRIGQGAIKVYGGGTVRPSAEVTVAPQVGGRVVWVAPAFVSGGRFAEGELLFRIDAADYENVVESAGAAVAQRNVAVLVAEEEVRVALDEWRRLAAREELDPESPNPLVTRQPQLDAARADLKSAQAQLEDARLALERTRIIAPFDGIVRDENVDLGQYLAPGQSVGRLYATGEVEIVVPLSDDEAALIERLWDTRAGSAEAGIAVDVTAEYGGAEYAWTGYVDRAEAALDEQTRTVNVVVSVPRPFALSPDDPGRPPLLIGSYATVAIEGASFDEYAVVPAAGLRDGDVVWTLQDDTLLVMVPVDPVQEVEDEVLVLGPVAEGTPVIVSALPFVTDGMTVQVTQLLESAPGLRARSAVIDPAAPAAEPDAMAAEEGDEAGGPDGSQEGGREEDDS